MSTPTFFFYALLVAAVWASGLGAVESGAAAIPQQAVALLEAKCWHCHGSEKGKGDLRMHTAEFLAVGGEGGPVLIAGNAEASRMIQAVKRGDPDTAMPPKDKDALTPEEIAILSQWIQAGAVWADAAAQPEPQSQAKPE